MSESSRLPILPRWREETVETEAMVPLLARRWRRCLPLAGASLFFFGALLGVFSWINNAEPTHLIPIWMTEFHCQRWPSLAAAQQDHERIVKGGFFHGRDLLNPAFGQRSALQHQLSLLRNIARHESVVIYISGYSGIDEQGNVYCLPSNSNPDSETDRLPLSEILLAVKQCPSVKKLLVLDISWSSPDPRLGVPSSLVLTRTRSLLNEIKDPHRQVLTSAADGQMALTCEELGQSVFGYYLAQGLRGQADGWNRQGAREGRVSVHELVAFVQSHVTRWARINREMEQVPLFLDAGEDFELVALASLDNQAWPTPPTAMKYPDWLNDAWKLRDQWTAARYRELFPRIFQQWEMAIRRAEQQWRFAPNSETMQSELNNVRQQLEARMKRQRALIPTPQLHSIALLKATGVTADAATVSALQELCTGLIAKTANQPPDKVATIKDGLIAKFQTATEKTTPAAMAIAVCDQLQQSPAPSADDVILFDRLVRAKQPEPYYAETLLLRKLAELATETQGEPWHSATAHQAVLTGMAAESVTVRALTFPWVVSLLDRAWQADHDAKVLLWSRGYASMQDADAKLHEAEQLLQMVQAYEDALTEAQYVLSDACQLLPEYFGRHLRDNQTPEAWFAAAKICTQLSEELTPPVVPLAADETSMRNHITDIRRQVLSLIDLYSPIQPVVVNQTVAECAEASAGPAVFLQTRQLLALPTLGAADRKKVWEAAHQLSLRLLTRTMEMDATNQLSYHPPQCVGDAVIPSQFESSVYDEMLGFRESLELLRVSHMDSKELEPAIAACQKALQEVSVSGGDISNTKITSMAKVAESVRKLWFETLPAEISACPNVAKQVQLSRLFPPYAANQTLDDPNGNPLLKIRASLHRQRWAWLSEHYQYAGRDVLGPRFYAESARDYAAVASPMPSPSFLSLTEVGESSAAVVNATVTAAVTWNWSGPTPNASAGQTQPVAAELAAQKQSRPNIAKSGKTFPALQSAAVNAFTPTDLLKVATARELPADMPLMLQLSMAPGVVPSDLVGVEGCLLQVGVEGRNYHLLVKVPSLGDSRSLDLLIGTTPLAPAQSLDMLQLRPIKGTQSFYLFARNLLTTPRDVRVDLIAGEQTLATAEVKLAASQTLPVTFAGTPPAPNTDLPEITLPIVLRAIDLADGSVLSERPVPCDMLSPREYLAVNNVVFDPSSPSQNSLNVNVQALSLENGPPLNVRLTVPSDQVPGLVGIQGGAFVGSLPSVGSTFLLQAKNMQFTASTREPGKFFVDVDDYPRAFVFSSMFPRQGDPIYPIEDNAPRLRLLAPRMGLAGPGFPVSLPTDNGPSGSTLELSIGQMRGRILQPELTTVLPASRHERFGLAPRGPQGELLAQASMRDWELKLDTTGIVGQRQLRARMLNVDGREVLNVQQTIVLDDSPPEQVSFINPPNRGAVKQEIALRAMGFDGLSGIAQVVFFIGKPVDGKMPAGVASVMADPMDLNGTMWSAQLTLPAVAGRTDLTVQFINGVGLSTFASIALEVLDPAALAVGNIQGTVVEGPRPQANLDVELLDAQGKPAKMAKTTAEGTYVFDGVAAGEYTVFVNKPSSQRQGKAPVKVEPGSNSKADISLAL